MPHMLRSLTRVPAGPRLTYGAAHDAMEDSEFMGFGFERRVITGFSTGRPRE